ncbi:hypothetical protein BGZ65_011179 [Modicella reniformis]|uniref:Uncharacterized protein n=1 Tax=Modicella reniformis TaxID=1440133 RepID=A0A9P6IRH3_9FUNG|nr:hypothetical protein BGZ65_011179 [Modicella reniformis]
MVSAINDTVYSLNSIRMYMFQAIPLYIAHILETNHNGGLTDTGPFLDPLLDKTMMNAICDRLSALLAAKLAAVWERAKAGRGLLEVDNESEGKEGEGEGGDGDGAGGDSAQRQKSNTIAGNAEFNTNQIGILAYHVQGLLLQKGMVISYFVSY